MNASTLNLAGMLGTAPSRSAIHIQSRRRNVSLSINRRAALSIVKPRSAELGLLTRASADSDASSDAAVSTPSEVSPVVSVNYFISRVCNYSCGFCFHTAKSQDVLSLEEAKRGMSALRDCGTKKINFAGGEPFLNPELLGELTRYCKEELGMATSIISNGSLITADWMQRYGPFLDILGISADSFNEDTNRRIGRGNGAHLSNVFLARAMCDDQGIKFKLNTVVNAYNWQEDMNENVEALAPSRWKVFQVLLLGGENMGGDDLRDARDLTITGAQFQSFLDRHAGHRSCLVPEDNDTMQNSYIMLDERLRFLDCSSGNKTPSESILDVGVLKALQQAGFDFEAFLRRGGIYSWNKHE